MHEVYLSYRWIQQEKQPWERLPPTYQYKVNILMQFFSFNAGKNHSTSLHLQYAITLPTDQYELCRQIMN